MPVRCGSGPLTDHSLRGATRHCRRSTTSLTTFGLSCKTVSFDPSRASHAPGGALTETRFPTTKTSAFFASSALRYCRAVAEETREVTPGRPLPPWPLDLSPSELARTTPVSATRARVLPTETPGVTRTGSSAGHTSGAASCAALLRGVVIAVGA